MKIRPSTKEDETAILSIATQEHVKDSMRFEEQERLLLENVGKPYVIVGESKGQVIGYIFYYFRGMRNTEAEDFRDVRIGMVGADINWRKKGVEEALISYVQDKVDMPKSIRIKPEDKELLSILFSLGFVIDKQSSTQDLLYLQSI